VKETALVFEKSARGVTGFTSPGFALFSANGIGVFRQTQTDMREKSFGV